MKIIQAPHPTLRTKAQEVTKLDKKILQFIPELEKTLDHSQNPKGVGLAAPQVDKKYRIFSTNLPLDGSDPDEDSALSLAHYINPEIKKTSNNRILGENAKDEDYRLEGCLSIPLLYGPVPRWEWVELEYSYIKLNANQEPELVRTKRKFSNFAARVIQHELDHLDGILFTDYLLEYDLPAYQPDPKTDKLEEIRNRQILEIL